MRSKIPRGEIGPRPSIEMRTPWKQSTNALQLASRTRGASGLSLALVLDPIAHKSPLLRKIQIERRNQVWCADITFVPVKNGFLYLVAIMDWATRKVLSWRLSNTIHADFCVDALNEAIAKHGPR